MITIQDIKDLKAVHLVHDFREQNDFNEKKEKLILAYDQDRNPLAVFVVHGGGLYTKIEAKDFDFFRLHKINPV